MLELALIPAYAVADAFAGGSLGKGAQSLDAKLPGRGAFWAAFVCAGAGYLLAGVPGALMGLVWLIYRSPGWKVFGGSATPVSGREIGGTLLRHLLAMLAVLVAYWGHKDIIIAAACFAAYAACATALAAVYGAANRDAQERGEPIDPWRNTACELCRGALFGFAIALSLGGA